MSAVVWLHTFYDTLWSLMAALRTPLTDNIGLGVLALTLVLMRRAATIVSARPLNYDSVFPF